MLLCVVVVVVVVVVVDSYMLWVAALLTQLEKLRKTCTVKTL